MGKREPSELEIRAAFQAFLQDAPTEVRPAVLVDQLARVHQVDRRARPWWSALVPPAGRSPALRLAWIVALVALLLAATVSAVFVGSELLRRSSELTVVLPPSVEPAPSGVPAPTAAPADVPEVLLPLVLDSVGEPTVSDTALGTVSWRFYSAFPEMIGGDNLLDARDGPAVFHHGTYLYWIDPDGTRQGTLLPGGTISGLAPVEGDGLVAYHPWQPRLYRLTWDGTRWLMGDGVDVPSVFGSGSVWQVAAGPHGLLVVANGAAVARDGEHFVAAAQPPGGAAPGGRLLATADGFVALLSPSEPNGSSDPLLEPVPWFSADGLAWEPASSVSPFGEGALIRSVAGRDGRFIAVGNIGSERGPWPGWVSDDGLAWERLPDLGLDEAEACATVGEPDDCGIGVTAGNAGWVIYTWYSTASSTVSSFASSADGLTWEPFPVWPANAEAWSGSGSGATGDLWPPHAALGGDTIVVTGLPDPPGGGAGDVVAVGTIEP